MKQNLKRLLGYAGAYKFSIIMALVCAFFASAGVVLATYLNGVAIDQIAGPGNVNFKGLILVLTSLGVIYLLSSLFQSPWASIQMTPMLPLCLFETAAMLPAAILWSPPRITGKRPSSRVSVTERYTRRFTSDTCS